MTKEEVLEAEKRIQAGEGLRKVAKDYNRCYQSLQYWRERFGFPKLKPSGRVFGKNHPNWKGGECMSWGYNRVYAPNRGRASKYTYEHVLVAEKKIGRLLKRNEHVHHIDANKLNNNPENLIVLNPSEHRLLHRQLEKLALELVIKGEIVYRNGEYQWK
jgi:hypothetical protein